MRATTTDARTSIRDSDSPVAVAVAADPGCGLMQLGPDSGVPALLDAFLHAELARLGPDSPLPGRAARALARLANEEGWEHVRDITPAAAEAAIHRIEGTPPISRGRRLRNALRALGRSSAQAPQLAPLAALRAFSPMRTAMPRLPMWSSDEIVRACRLARHAEQSVIWPRTTGPATSATSPQSIGFEALVRLLVLWAVRPYEVHDLRVWQWESASGQLTIATRVPRTFPVDERTAWCLRTLANRRPADDVLFRHPDGRPWSLKLQNGWMRWLRQRLELTGSLRICRRSAILFLTRLAPPGDLELIASITGTHLPGHHLGWAGPVDAASVTTRQQQLAEAVGRASS